MKSIISEKRYEECRKIREGYIPKKAEWIEVDHRVWSSDFGDYTAVVKYTSVQSQDDYIYWEVHKKIVNELFGEGFLHKKYNYEPSTKKVEDIQNHCEKLVEKYRAEDD